MSTERSLAAMCSRIPRVASVALLACVMAAGCVVIPPPTPVTTPVGRWVLDEDAYRAQPPVIIARERASGDLDGNASAGLLAVVGEEIDEIATDHVARGIVYDYRADGTMRITDSSGMVGFGRWTRDGIAVDLVMEQPEAYLVRGLLTGGRLIMQPVPDAGERLEYFTSFFRPLE